MRGFGLPNSVPGRSMCPACGCHNEAATDPTGAFKVPAAGDCSVCFACGEPSVFTGKGNQVRPPTEVELAEIMDDEKARTAITLIKALRA